MENGDIFGNYSTSPTSQASYGFLWNGSDYTQISDPLAVLNPAVTSGTHVFGFDGGNVVGVYDNGTNQQGFVWSNSTYTTLSGPGNVLAHSVDGSTAVGYSLTSSGGGTGLAWNITAATEANPPDSINSVVISPPGATASAASAIQGSEIVGSYVDPSGDVDSFVYNGSSYISFAVPGFTRTNALFPSDGEFAGNCGNGAGVALNGFVWTGASFILLHDPLSNSTTTVTGMSGGYVYGIYSTADNYDDAFIWNGSSYTTFNIPGAASTSISGIYGQTILGTYEDSAGHDYIYEAVDTSIVPEQASVWNGAGTTANWSDGNNWDGNAPSAGSTLVFTAVNQLATNNDFPADTQFNGILFDATAEPFTLSGNGINLNGDITNNSPSPQTINLNLALQQNINITAATQSIAIAGNIGGNFGVTLCGPGTVTFSGASTYSGATIVAGGTLVVGSAGALPANTSLSIGSSGTAAAVQLAANVGPCAVSSLAIAAGSTLDIANNTLTINYGNGADPISAIESYLQSGGIFSSFVASLNASQNQFVYGIGSADGADGIVAGISAGQIEIMPTLLGDAKLEGAVDFGDFQLLSQYFGQSGGWDEGNFTYGPTIDFGDFQLLAQNFGSAPGFTAGELASLNGFAGAFGYRLIGNAGGVGFQVLPMPEPASVGLATAITMASLLRRRRRPGGQGRRYPKSNATSLKIGNAVE